MRKQAPVSCLLLMLALSITGHLTAQKDIAQQNAAFRSNANVAVELPVKKNYDQDAKSWYAVYATGVILHVYLAVTDPLQQRKIITNGMELWIDTKGKKNKKTGIIFPFNLHTTNEKSIQEPPAGFNGRAGFNNHISPDTNNIQLLEKTIAGQREMKLTGFKEDLNGTQNINHLSGIKLSLYFKKDTLVYYAQLPLNTLSEPVLVNSRISVCLIEKGMTMQDFEGNQMPPPDGGGDGTAPPPGGGGPPPVGEDGMRMFQDDIIWCKLLL